MGRMKYIENYTDRELSRMHEWDEERLISSEVKRAGIILPRRPSCPGQPVPPHGTSHYAETHEGPTRTYIRQDEMENWILDYENESVQESWCNNNRILIKQDPPTKKQVTTHNKETKVYEKKLKQYAIDIDVYEKLEEKYKIISEMVQIRIGQARETIVTIDICVPKYMEYIDLAKGDKDIAFSFLLHHHPELKDVEDFKLIVMERVLDNSI